MEREIKLRILEESQVATLLQVLPEPERVLHQTNYYFDTPDRALRLRHKAMLRLRESETEQVFTLKRASTFVDGYLQAEDYEEPTEVTSADLRDGRLDTGALPEPIRGIVRGEYGLAVLGLQGEIRNERHVIPMPQGFTIEFDKTVFPGPRIDYEIEVETEDPVTVRLALVALLEQNAIEYANETMTKYSRFLEALGIADTPRE